MRIDLHSADGRAVARVDAEVENPPPVVHGRRADGSVEEHFLDWDGAFDDEGHLRKCPACACADLYVRRLFPPLAGFVAMLLIGFAGLALYGFEHVGIDTLIALVLAVGVAHFLLTRFSARYLACYRCGSGYHDIPIPRTRREWDATVAERYLSETGPAMRAK